MNPKVLADMRCYPVTSLANIFFFGMIGYAIIEWIRTKSMWSTTINGYPHYSSIITFSIFFIAVSYKFKAIEKNQRSKLPRDFWIFGSTMVSLISIMLFYELIYLFSFIDIKEPIKWLFDKYNSYTLVWNGSLASMWFITVPFWRIRGNYTFLVSSLSFIVTYVIWLLIGFPQNLQFWGGEWKFFPFRWDVEALNISSKAFLFISAYSMLVKK